MEIVELLFPESIFIHLVSLLISVEHTFIGVGRFRILGGRGGCKV